MKNKRYYFSHDYYARFDPKCQALIAEYGIGAYGVYWSLMEIMHEQGGKIKKFPRLYDGLSSDLKIEKDELMKQIKAMLYDFELLLEDDDYIWSDRVLKNIEEIEAKRMTKAEAGHRGGINSGISRLQRSKTKQGFEANEVNEPKESKVKESKVKEISNTGTEVPRTLFKPPEQKEVQDYITAQGWDVDADRFVAFYESKGWMIGKNKMKNWKAAVKTWQYSNNPKSSGDDEPWIIKKK